MGFKEDIQAFQEKALQEINTKACAVYSTLADVAIAKTPTLGFGVYAKGHLKNQWKSTANGTNLSFNLSVDPSGSQSLSAVQAAISSKPFYNVDGYITLSNSLHYAYRADKIGWLTSDNARWKNKAAYNMTEQAIGFTKRAFT
jgi:hypothetical protein